MGATLDQKYYQVVPPRSAAKWLTIAARDRIFRDFMAHMQPSPSDRILDVGVSDVVNDSANVLERSYPHRSNITACGLGKGTGFQEAFPEVGYVRVRPNSRLPFDDAGFAIATSNAVLEHVGSLESQAFFVSELCRVAARVFITVPNRFFPIEHHTAIPGAHFVDATFRLACRFAGKLEWSRDENLIFMTRKRLRELAAPIGRSAAVGYTGLLFGPFSSNLYLAFN
jgi:hypothetical protein